VPPQVPTPEFMGAGFGVGQAHGQSPAGTYRIGLDRTIAYDALRRPTGVITSDMRADQPRRAGAFGPPIWRVRSLLADMPAKLFDESTDRGQRSSQAAGYET
jgi:hypothetical protein